MLAIILKTIPTEIINVIVHNIYEPVNRKSEQRAHISGKELFEIFLWDDLMWFPIWLVVSIEIACKICSFFVVVFCFFICIFYCRTKNKGKCCEREIWLDRWGFPIDYFCSIGFVNRKLMTCMLPGVFFLIEWCWNRFLLLGLDVKYIYLDVLRVVVAFDWFIRLEFN